MRIGVRTNSDGCLLTSHIRLPKRFADDPRIAEPALPFTECSLIPHTHND